MTRKIFFIMSAACALFACSEPTSRDEPTKSDPAAPDPPTSQPTNPSGGPSSSSSGVGTTTDGPVGTQASPLKLTRTLGIVLYRSFELLDVYGPAEMFAYVGPQLKVVMIAEKAGPVTSAQGSKVLAEYGFDDAPPLDLVMVPGGIGTFPELVDSATLDFLRARAASAEIVMSVCTGSAILARAGLLDGYKATSNKRFFSIARTAGPKVEWIDKARWVEDRDRVTSSGVSAGIDMSLAVIARLWGEERATTIAYYTEYTWHKDPTDDPFFVP